MTCVPFDVFEVNFNLSKIDNVKSINFHLKLPDKFFPFSYV